MNLIRRCSLSYTLMLLLALPTAFAGGPFAIGLEEVVSDGVPAPGAGNLETVADTDDYTFTAAAGTIVYFDELAGVCGIRWRVEDSVGTEIFLDNAMCSADPGQMTLGLGGTYTITVFGNGSATGTYSFTVWEVNPPEQFVISTKDVVSEDVPGLGAGNIEEPGATDVYEIDLTAGVPLYFEELAGVCGIRWRMDDPIGAEVFVDNAMCSGDPGPITPGLTGTYTITAFSNQSATGTYAFTIWEVNPPDQFVISTKDVVSENVPGLGAGNIEEAGTVDVYEIILTAGETFYFDELDGGCGIRWRMDDPIGAEVFVDNAICSGDPGEITPGLTGTYTITVFGNQSVTGTYSFTIWEVNPPDQFVISVKDVVSENVPGLGAGNIEEPGAADVYEIVLTGGETLYFDELGGACGIRWRMDDPNGTEVFVDNAICGGDPGEITPGLTGMHTITVSGNQSTTGTYSFTIWEVNPPEQFTIGVDEIVSDGVPAAGAGNLEEPGAADQYTLAVPPQTLVCFEELDGGCGIAWCAEAPGGAEIFSDVSVCATNPGQFLLVAGGAYTITVFGVGDTTGTYSFIVNPGRPADLDGNCSVGFSDLSILLTAWGTPDADLNGDASTGFSDLVVLLNDWG